MIDASLLTSWQSCRRQAVLRSEWMPLHWRPKHLFTAVVRQAIFKVSNGADPCEASQEAITTFMKEAANPGLDLVEGSDSFVIARDWAAMISTVVRGAAKLTLLTVQIPELITLAEGVDWQPNAWADDSGQLHRWIVVDSWGDAEFYREIHGWHAFGDIVATECPMMVHIIEIGSQRGGRRHSSWARGFKHPGLSSLRMHFRRRDGSPLKGWNPVFLADERMDPDEWVEQMLAEGELTRIMRHITINVPSKNTVAETRSQIVREALALQAVDEPWYSLPMSRGACDGMVPCPYQAICYTEKLVDIDTLGIYKQVGTGTSREEVAQ